MMAGFVIRAGPVGLLDDDSPALKPFQVILPLPIFSTFSSDAFRMSALSDRCRAFKLRQASA
jgi:hypothetical protein